MPCWINCALPMRSRIRVLHRHHDPDAMHPRELLPTEHHHRSPVLGRLFLSKHLIADPVHERQLLSYRLHQPNHLCCWIRVRQPHAAGGMQPGQLLSERHHRASKLPSGVCVRYACYESGVRPAQLLPAQLHFTNSMRRWEFLSKHHSAISVPRQQLLQPGRHRAVHLQRLLQRPVHRERVQLQQQHRVQGVHGPRVQRGLHGRR